ncbi:hypothetical protein J4G37_59890, partial [Microvirga sp. 3-52]|nr:hypothetical protein [Microvirga sp. 3-52]
MELINNVMTYFKSTSPRNKKSLPRLLTVLELLCVILVIIFLFLPIVWIFITAFKPDAATYTTSVIFKATLDNFKTV